MNPDITANILFHLITTVGKLHYIFQHNKNVLFTFPKETKQNMKLLKHFLILVWNIQVFILILIP